MITDKHFNLHLCGGGRFRGLGFRVWGHRGGGGCGGQGWWRKG